MFLEGTAKVAEEPQQTVIWRGGQKEPLALSPSHNLGSLKQKFPFFPEDQAQVNDLKTLCLDLNNVLLRFTASFHLSGASACLVSPTQLVATPARAGGFGMCQSHASLGELPPSSLLAL